MGAVPSTNAGLSAITGQLAVLNKEAQALAGRLDQAHTAWANDPNSPSHKAMFEAVKARLEGLNKRRAALESQLAGTHVHHIGPNFAPCHVCA
jgi:hypothetical protein